MTEGCRIHWPRLVQILVKEFHQPIKDAWATTMREFICLISVAEAEGVLTAPKIFDRDRLAEFEEHLRSLGVEGV